MFFNLTWLLLVGPAILLGLYAQWKVRSTYRRYAQVAASSGLTARQTAQRILERLPERVTIESINGTLADHYDPREKVLRLSNPDSRALADIGVAAHEAGHALQDASNYQPLAWRTAVVPVANFGSQLAGPLLMAAFLAVPLLRLPQLFQPLLLAAILAFSVAMLFTVVTLPVEFNASRRAMVLLRQSGAVTSGQELAAVGKVLNAAALTYVAAAAAAVLQLVYYIMIYLGQQRR